MSKHWCACSIGLDNGYNLCVLHEHIHSPLPKARAFEMSHDLVHYAPDRPADVTHITLDIALDFEYETISGTASTTFSVLYEKIKTLTFDAVGLRIGRVTLADKTELAYTHDAKKLIVNLDRPYVHGEELTIAITCAGKPHMGLHFVKPAEEDPAHPIQVWTLGQPQYASFWFPCHDAPSERPATEIFATVPAQYITISNGTLLKVIDHGATKTHHWRHDIPHAAYLVSLVVGEFAVIKAEYNGKPVNYYVRPDRTLAGSSAHSLMGSPLRVCFWFLWIADDDHHPLDMYASNPIPVRNDGFVSLHLARGFQRAGEVNRISQ